MFTRRNQLWWHKMVRDYPELSQFDEFLLKLDKHTQQKATMYDGSNRDHSVDKVIRFATEELGEIAGAITRERYELAKAECLDLAHCAYLLYIAIGREIDNVHS